MTITNRIKDAIPTDPKVLRSYRESNLMVKQRGQFFLIRDARNQHCASWHRFDVPGKEE